MSDYYTVSELTDLIKEELETRFDWIELRGEVSNFKRHSSGHLYFTLKDAASQINAIIWRTTASQLDFQPEDGLELVVAGRVEVYAAMGKYQVICTYAKPVGEGFLQKEFEKRLRRLQAEGLFDESRKKPLPRLPEIIGIITSPTGAVIEDMKSVLARRYPSARLLLAPVRVQGETAKEEIVAALRFFNAMETGKPDVLIVGRGGGSLEDLWAFNEETVARAIAASQIPVISAVGHQTDITIADLVADVRAGTPSMAAELAAPAAPEILTGIDRTIAALGDTLLSSIDAHRQQLYSLTESYVFNKPRRKLETLMQHLDMVEMKLGDALHHKFLARQSRLAAASERLQSLSPELVMQRGFALVFKDGSLVRSAKDFSTGDVFTLRFADGTVAASVLNAGQP